MRAADAFSPWLESYVPVRALQIVPRIVTHFRQEIFLFSVLDSQYFLHTLSFTSCCPHLNLICLCQWKYEMNSWGFSRSYNRCFCSSSSHLLLAASDRVVRVLQNIVIIQCNYNKLPVNSHMWHTLCLHYCRRSRLTTCLISAS